MLFAMFMHGSWFHLFGNMLFLVDLRRQCRGPIRPHQLPDLLSPLAGQVAADPFAQYFAAAPVNQYQCRCVRRHRRRVGAYLVIYPRAKVWSLLPFLFFIPVRIPAWLVLGSWFVLQWLYSAGLRCRRRGRRGLRGPCLRLPGRPRRRPDRARRLPATAVPGPPPLRLSPRGPRPRRGAILAIMPTLAVIGAGPKGIAIAAKARALTAAGFPPPGWCSSSRVRSPGTGPAVRATPAACCRWARRPRKTSATPTPRAGARTQPRSPRRWRTTAGSGT